MTFAHAQREGVVPALKCLKCGQMAALTNLLWGDLHFHVYKCVSCGAMNASPTVRSKCKKFGIISKDLAANDCLLCPIPKLEGFDVMKQTCPYYERKLTTKEFMEEIDRLKTDGAKRIGGRAVERSDDAENELERLRKGRDLRGGKAAG